MSVTEEINGHRVKRNKRGDLDSHKYICIDCDGLADNKDDYREVECE